MRNPVLSFAVAGLSFLAGLGVSARFPAAHAASLEVTYPAVAYAAGSCSVATLVCANDSSPGCETICGGEQQAVCVEGTCSSGGNVATPNRCSCK